MAYELTTEQSKSLMQGINGHLGARKDKLMALQKGLNVDRSIQIILALAARDQKVLQCSAESIFLVLHTSTQIGLELATPLQHAHLVPRWNYKLYGKVDGKYKGGYEATFQAGYKGLAELVHRTKLFKTPYMYPVYNGDEFRFVLGLRRDLVHVPNLDDETYGTEDALKAAYCVFETKDGDTLFEPMTRKQLESHRDRFAPRAKSEVEDVPGPIVGPWVTDFTAMCLKTVVKRACKLLPMSPELAQAIEADTDSELKNVNEVDSTPPLVISTGSKADAVLAAARAKKQEVPAPAVTVEAQTVTVEPTTEAATEPAKTPRGRPKKTESTAAESAPAEQVSAPAETPMKKVESTEPAVGTPAQPVACDHDPKNRDGSPLGWHCPKCKLNFSQSIGEELVRAKGGDPLKSYGAIHKPQPDPAKLLDKSAPTTVTPPPKATPAAKKTETPAPAAAVAPLEMETINIENIVIPYEGWIKIMATNNDVFYSNKKSVIDVVTPEKGTGSFVKLTFKRDDHKRAIVSAASVLVSEEDPNIEEPIQEDIP